jgi:hypothetical protein
VSTPPRTSVPQVVPRLVISKKPSSRRPNVGAGEVDFAGAEMMVSRSISEGLSCAHRARQA